MDLNLCSILTSYLLFVSLTLSCLRHHSESSSHGKHACSRLETKTRTNLRQAVENDNKHRACQYTLNRDVATMEADRR